MNQPPEPALRFRGGDRHHLFNNHGTWFLRYCVRDAAWLKAERRLTDFKVRHFGATGVAKEDYFLRMSVMQESLHTLPAGRHGHQHLEDKSKSRHQPKWKKTTMLLSFIGFSHGDALPLSRALPINHDHCAASKLSSHHCWAQQPTIPGNQRKRWQPELPDAARH
jgi:hypothetical protein